MKTSIKMMLMSAVLISIAGFIGYDQQRIRTNKVNKDRERLIYLNAERNKLARQIESFSKREVGDKPELVRYNEIWAEIVEIRNRHPSMSTYEEVTEK